MAKLGKAARGKRRWLGVAVDNRLTSRPDVEKIMAEIPALSRARLYDFFSLKNIHANDGNGGVDELGRSTESENIPIKGTRLSVTSDNETETGLNLPEEDQDRGLAIFRLPLSDCAAARQALSQNDSLFQPLTTSGKIRLVRDRLGLPIRRHRR
jgi:hypothetical protein